MPPPSSRRSSANWIAAAAIGLAAIAAAVYWWPRGAAFAVQPNSDQNVLLVTIDTLRGDALSSYGGPAATPNLDALAAHGARFTFAHAHAVVTLVSHTSILTGRFPYEHGIRDNSGYRLADGTPTLGTRLKAAGFATGAFIGGFTVSKRFGLSPGFDAYDDQLPEMKGEVAFSLPERRADVVVSRAVDWIGKQDRKFFAWVHAFDPHSPYKPPEEYQAKYAAQPYYGEVAFVDHALGPLFDRLATLPRPTLVIVTADHGESLGEHREMTHGMFAYESTLHVPLIVAVVDPKASSRPRGLVIDAPVRHIDLVPTVLDLTGVGADASLPGASLRPVIDSGDASDRPGYFESMTYNLVRGWAPLRGVLAGREKYIDLPLPELYDLKSDPKEASNLIRDRADRVPVLAATLKTYNMAPPQRPGQESASDRAAMAALGYISGVAAAKRVYTEADDPKNLVDVDNDLHAATDFYQNGKVDEAIAKFKSVIARRKDTADAYIQLAYAYWERGQVREAIATLEDALKNGSPDRDVRIRLGIYLAESHTDAKRAITVLEGLPVGDVEALNGLGIAYVEAGRYADAMKTFERVLTLDPTNGLAFQNLASTILSATSGRKPDPVKLKQAEDYARQAILSDPSLAKAYSTYGTIMMMQDRKKEAVESWQHAIDLDGSEFNALYNLWLEAAQAGRRDDAMKYGRQFVQTAPPEFFGAAIAEIRRWLGGKPEVKPELSRS